MVVEDDRDVCKSLEAIVHALGHVCQTLGSAEALLLRWNRDNRIGNHCDVVILDIDLLKIDRIELLSKLFEDGSGDVSILQKGSETSRIADLLREFFGRSRHLLRMTARPCGNSRLE